MTHYWKGSRGGGVKTYLMALVDNLIKNGNKPFVIFSEGEDPENYKIYGNRFIFPIKAIFVLRKIRPDVINAQFPWFLLLPGYLWKKINGIRLVCTVHTIINHQPCFPEKEFMRFLLERCDNVVFTSNYLEDQIRGAYNIGIMASIVIRPGIAQKSISDKEVESFRVKFSIPENSILLLGQGLTAHRVKIEGVKRLIIAMKKLRGSYPNMLLILTRNSDSVSELKEYIAEYDMSQYVIFTGDLDEPLVAIKACDILTHITMDDAFPLAILEAMSFGMPIIASAVGGIPEIINEHNGQLVSNDPDDISKAIDFFLRNWEIAEMRGKVAQHDSDLYDWSKTAKIYMSLYMAK